MEKELIKLRAYLENVCVKYGWERFKEDIVSDFFIEFMEEHLTPLKKKLKEDRNLTFSVAVKHKFKQYLRCLGNKSDIYTGKKAGRSNWNVYRNSRITDSMSEDFDIPDEIDEVDESFVQYLFNVCTPDEKEVLTFMYLKFADGKADPDKLKLYKIDSSIDYRVLMIKKRWTLNSVALATTKLKDKYYESYNKFRSSVSR